MQGDKQNKADTEIKSVTYLAIAANAALFFLKLVIGVLGGSMALVADAIHSLSDMSTDFAVLLGMYFGSKKPDAEHPYGHGRVETFSAVFIAVVLVFIGSALIYHAATGIGDAKTVTPHQTVLAAAVVSIIAKELLYKITKRIARRTGSSALYANAWHHRSDALSSVVVLIGFVSVKAGFAYGDHIAAVGVGLMIILVAIHIFGDCLRELTEGAVDSETVELIKKVINSNSSIHHWHDLRTRAVGRELFLDVHILVEPELNITDAHQIAESLENSLHEQISRPVNIVVHIEPDIPEMRK